MKNFILKTLSAVLFLVVVSGLINWIIDPFNIFHTTFLKYQFQMNERFMKIEYLDKNHKKFNSYLIGSSRIGTTNPKILDKYIPNAKFYNFTVSSATIADELRHIRYMIRANYKIENLYLQVDINDNMQTYLQQDSDYLRKPHPYVIGKNIFNYKLEYLLNIFPFNTKGKIEKNIEGNNDAEYNLDLGTWSRPNKDLRAEQDCDKYVKSEPEFAVQNLQSIRNVATKINFKALKEIIDLCRKNNINLIVFTTPHNHNYLDSVYENEYYLFLKELLNITDYWNFSGYNSVTTNDCNYYESSHYRSKIGILIMARIFNDKNISVPTDFGVKLTKENIEAYLTKLRNEREVWRKTHPKDVAETEALRNKK